MSGTSGASGAVRSRLRSVRPGTWVLAVVGLLVVLGAAWPSLLAPGDPLAVHPEAGFGAPSWAHPFGTDESGRDVYVRMMHGAGASVLIGVASTVLGVGLGAVLGIYLGLPVLLWDERWSTAAAERAMIAQDMSRAKGAVLGLITGLGSRLLDAAGSRLIDAMLAVPTLLLALLLIAVRGPGVGTVLVAVGLSSAPGYARLLRSEVRRVSRAGHVEAARMLGKPPLRLIFQHVLPGALGPLLAVATLGVGQAIVWASALGYLGLGAPPPAPEWGAMLNAGRNYIDTAWWMTVFPGLAIVGVGVLATLAGRRLSAHWAGRKERP